MNILPHYHHSCEVTSSKIQQFFAEFHVGQLLRSCNAYKMRGFAVMAIFLVAFEAAFQRRSLYQRKKDAPNSIQFEKETRFIFYDALTAHTSIVFARYMMLSLEQRSMGELFFLAVDELEDLHYLKALSLLLSLLMDCAKDAEILDEEQINQLLDLFMAKLPDLWGKYLKQCA